MILNVSSGGAAVAGSWRFTTASAKPEAVAKRTMLAVTTQTVTKITVADGAPDEPETGDVWFHIANPEDGRAMSDGSVPVKCFGAYQYADDAWALLTAYYSYLGVWWEVPGLPAEGTTLSDCTWAQIDRIGKAGKAEDYFAVGDTKQIVLSTSETLTLRIIGFGHDDLSAEGGGKAAITFDTVDCMNTTAALNTGLSNSGGWSGSALYPSLTNTIFGTLPAELRSVVKQVDKKTSAGLQSASIVTSADKLFLLSEIEVQGATSFTRAGEGVQYALFTSGGTKLKKLGANTHAWWLRSPYSGDSASFAYVNVTGAATYTYANTVYGIAFGLCV